MRNDELSEKADELAAKINTEKTALNSASDSADRIKKLGERLHKSLEDGSVECGELVGELLDSVTVKRLSKDEVSLKIALKTDVPQANSSGRISGGHSILSYDIGISQAQVSRLEKGALERIRKQLV